MTDEFLGQKEGLVFDSLKESRGKYFVEYSPPTPHVPHAILNLVFCESIGGDEARQLLEEEMRRWLARYPFPLFAAAYDEKEDAIAVNGEKSKNFVYGWVDVKTNSVVISTELDDLGQQIKLHSGRSDLKKIFSDIPYKTRAQIRAEGEKSVLEFRRNVRVLKVILALWLTVIPAAFALVEFFGPEWLGAIVCLFSLWKASQAFLEIMGYTKTSESKEKTAEKKQKMEHYFYHCERNPRGFDRLKIENFDEDSRKRIQEEFERLKT